MSSVVNRKGMEAACNDTELSGSASAANAIQRRGDEAHIATSPASHHLHAMHRATLKHRVVTRTDEIQL